MTIFVTKEYMQASKARVQQIEKDLERIRCEKNSAFEEDTNSWHDNFAYESATREEKLTEDKLFQAMRDLDKLRIFTGVVPAIPKVVGLYCLVRVLEENLANLKQIEKTIGIVPLGAENHKKLIYSYNAPIVSPLMGAKVGDERVIKIPMGTFKVKVLSIEKMR